MAVSLRIPEETKKRIAKLARARELTPHGFMLAAIQEKLEAEEARAKFVAEAERRLRRMKRTGRGVPVEEAFEYLNRRAGGGAARRPKARRIP